MSEAEMEIKYDEHMPRHGRFTYDYGGYDYGYGRDYGYESVCCDRPVGRETFNLQKIISNLESENSLLKSENDSEKKMVEVYKELSKQISENEKADQKRWEKQLIWNARQDARLEVLERDIHQLYSLTGLYVKADRVTPPITNAEPTA